MVNKYCGKSYILKIRVGVVGIGAMGHGIVQVIQRNEDMEVVAVSDRNLPKLNRVKPFLSKNTLITPNPIEVLTVKPDVLVEASGAVIEAALLIKKALEKKIHVVTLNGEVDQVFGLLLAKEAEANGVLYSSDAGDQPGALSHKIEQVRNMGFEIVMAGNNKGFLNRYANPVVIKEEALKRRLSLKRCTSFTDGTKLAMEMALVSNAFNLTILQTGMIGPVLMNVNEVLNVYDLERARDLGGVVDYVVGAKPGGSVFVIGYSRDPEDQFYMNYYKMGEGPYYLFIRPYHLCHFETPLAIKRIMKGEPFLVQKKRVLEVVAYAKIDLEPGTILDGIGGYHLYGLLEKQGGLPIGLTEGTKLLSKKKRDEKIEWEDVDFPTNDSRLDLWNKQEALL